MKATMSTPQVSFAIQGMFCAKCAVKVESALMRLDGVVAAQVNYATERARVIYDPMHLYGTAMVDAVRGEGFDVRMQHFALDVDGLLYATSRQFVERMLHRTIGVSNVTLDFGGEHVEIDTFADDSSLRDIQRTLGRLGFVTESAPSKSIRWFVARTVIAVLLALVIALSAGEHVGWLATTSIIHLPFVAVTLGMFALFVTALPFYHFAFDAGLQGEFDAGVLIALISLVSFLIGIPLALIAPTTWLTGIAFVFATTLTAGWFLARALTALVLPRITKPKLAVPRPAASQTQFKAVSNSSN
jgi:Cu+-exporting ATPase